MGQTSTVAVFRYLRKIWEGRKTVKSTIIGDHRFLSFRLLRYQRYPSFLKSSSSKFLTVYVTVTDQSRASRSRFLQATKAYGYATNQNSSPVYTYPDISENGDSFSSNVKKYASTHVFDSYWSAHSTNTRKRFANANLHL